MKSAYVSFWKFGSFGGFILIRALFYFFFGPHLFSKISSSLNVDISLGERVKPLISIHSFVGWLFSRIVQSWSLGACHHPARQELQTMRCFLSCDEVTPTFIACSLGKFWTSALCWFRTKCHQPPTSVSGLACWRAHQQTFLWQPLNSKNSCYLTDTAGWEF